MRSTTNSSLNSREAKLKFSALGPNTNHRAGKLMFSPKIQPSSKTIDKESNKEN